MSDFKTLKGLFIKHVSSDPSNPIEGQIWYNTSTQTLKGQILIEAWASGENLGTAGTGMAGAGTQTAGLCAGRRQPPASPNYVGLSEEYDGSSWTEGNNLNTARGYVAGCGTQTAAVAAGGYVDGTDKVESEEYDGTNWAEGDDLNTHRRQYSMFGIQTAAVAAAGVQAPGSPIGTSLVKTEEYNGSSWTTVEDMPTALNNHGAAGILTAGLVFGGGGLPGHPEGSGDIVSLTWEYDGTDWTAGGALNTGRGQQMGHGGTQTAAWAAGGGKPPGAVTNVEHYNGTSWVLAPSIASARTWSGSANAATQPAGMMFGGSNSNATEEYSSAKTTRTVDTT